MTTSKDSPGAGTVRDVEVHRAAALAAEGALMLDVREANEWRAGHMVDATHVPLGELDASTLALGTPIVAVCRSGNRSGTAAAQLLSAGHDVVNMAGGMLAWQEAGLIVTTDSGGPGTI